MPEQPQIEGRQGRGMAPHHAPVRCQAGLGKALGLGGDQVAGGQRYGLARQSAAPSAAQVNASQLKLIHGRDGVNSSNSVAQSTRRRDDAQLPQPPQLPQLPPLPQQDPDTMPTPNASPSAAPDTAQLTTPELAPGLPQWEGAGTHRVPFAVYTDRKSVV